MESVIHELKRKGVDNIWSMSDQEFALFVRNRNARRARTFDRHLAEEIASMHVGDTLIVTSPVAKVSRAVEQAQLTGQRYKLSDGGRCVTRTA